jgi:hypothetical protein
VRKASVTGRVLHSEGTFSRLRKPARRTLYTHSSFHLQMLATSILLQRRPNGNPIRGGVQPNSSDGPHTLVNDVDGLCEAFCLILVVSLFTDLFIYESKGERGPLFRLNSTPSRPDWGQTSPKPHNKRNSCADREARSLGKRITFAVSLLLKPEQKALNICRCSLETQTEPNGH